MARDVFISVSSKDRPTGEAVCTKLEAHGIGCWIAPRDVAPGEEWAESIIEAIGSARCVVLVFSANANASPQIRREVERAVSKGVMIIPLRIENVQPSRTLEYFISMPHWLDAYTPPLARHLDALVLRIKAIVDKGKSGTPLTTDEFTQMFPPKSAQMPKPVRAAPAPETAAVTVIASPRAPARADRSAAETQIVRRDRPSLPPAAWRLGTLPPAALAGMAVGVVVVIGGIYWLAEHGSSSPAEKSSNGQEASDSTAPHDAATTQGDQAYGRRDYAEAARLYRAAADQGQAAAQSRLGALYQRGLGVAQDYREAARWYRKAADQGLVTAQYQLGYFAQHGQGAPRDYAEAMRWYRQAAAKGFAQAENQIGYLYLNGLGVTGDRVEAMRWYRQAADQGLAAAQYSLGLSYADGLGVKQDPAQARDWMTKAAAGGSAEAKEWLRAH